MEDTIEVQLARVIERINASTLVTEERWLRLEQAITYGDTQSAQAITLLTSAVTRLEQNQRDQGKDLRARELLEPRLAALERDAARDAPRLRAVEDAVLSLKMVAVVAGTVASIIGAVAGVLVKIIGG